MNTDAEQLAIVMSKNGFQPSAIHDPSYIEYVKTYADEHGRLAKAVVQFHRPGSFVAAHATTRLAGFTVLVQAHVDATLEAVTERAPPVMRADLLAVVVALGEEEAVIRQSLAHERCSVCGASITEFFVEGDQVLCRVCRENA